jgi:hypothetical protein
MELQEQSTLGVGEVAAALLLVAVLVALADLELSYFDIKHIHN